MYNDFYQFSKEPFNITPDPAFLYMSPSHQEAMAMIAYGIENRKAFILVTGEVGTGKTSVLRAFLQDLKPDNIRYVYIINPNITFREFLEKIFRELGMDTEGLTTTQLVEKLQRVLVDEYVEGRNFVVVIDEAQNMPVETLENMRLLSNLETSTYKLIQIVFAAPPEFEAILDHPRLQSLKQRIAVRARILPLSAKESEEYIRHRLSVASKGGDPVFTERAVKMIAARAKGIPRVINILCDNALVTGLGYHEKPVGAKIVREVIADYRSDAKPKGKKNRSPVWVPVAACLAALLLVVLAFMLYRVFDVLEEHKAQLARLRQPIVKGKIDPALRERALAGTDSPDRGSAGPAPADGERAPDPFGAPAKAAGGPEAAAGRFPHTAVVKKDDTLFGMTVRAYGFSNDRVMEFVKKNNPSIKDVKQIEVGTTIVFPPLDESLKESPRK
ncbi:MAG: AAA family ATPase [Syntrophaceae bacterium]|nr:AAA family ATPase [Syntrophaceae bacterium]